MEFNATFLATIVSFIVFVFLMNKVLYAPILNVMEARKNFIADNLKTAEKNNAKSKKLAEKREEKLLEAKEDAKEAFQETIEEFKTQGDKVIADAQEIANDNVEQSKIELENISNEAKQSLKGSMVDLANDIVEKVIGYRSEVQGFDDRTVDEILYK